MAAVSDSSPEQYCRDIENYLCRKNDGHLVRIVGPAFEQVCGWALRGVPIKVAYRGIDRYFERYYAKGPRRRPVRVEFCEADVLDVFDEWRRAVGITARVAEAGATYGAESVGPSLPDPPSLDPSPDDPKRPHVSLPAHLERVIARLTALRAGEDRSLDAVLDAAVRELDAARGTAKGLRGAAREALLDRLRSLDASLLEAARARCDADTLRQLQAEADAELAPFRDRMPAEAYTQSRSACVDRILRERQRLPLIAFER